ncbi:MAG: xanthine dehydrogenase family protein molybdopterin-binding subunit [Nitrospinota bacterium]
MNLATTQRFTTVGKSLPRLDGPEKALGMAVFGDDVFLPGTLVGRVLRSPMAHARIVNIRVEAAKNLPGVHAVVTGRDIPDVHYGDVVKDRRAVALEKVRHVGDPVALVAAEDAETAEAALRLIQVDYQELATLTGPLEALREGAGLVHEDSCRYEAPGGIERRGNICAGKVSEMGDPDAAWEKAEVVIEGEFITPEVHAAYIEPHAALASVDPAGKVTVWTTTQGSYGCRKHTARVMGLPLSKVNVIPTAVGGGFGAKMPTLIEPLAALLARAAGRPVKLTLTREEDFEGSTPRHPTITRSRLGADREGNILVKEVDFYLDTGAYTDLVPIMVATRAQMAVGPYRVPHARVRIYAVYTNKPSCGIVRAPAGPQLTFVAETQMDELARRTGIDPYELRLRNSLRLGDVGMDGEVKSQISLPETLRRAREAAGFPPEGGDGHLYGRGVASGFWRGPAGAASCSVRLDDDGTAQIITGSVDITGSSTSIAQVVAEELGLPADQVNIVTADTDSGSLSPGSGGSQITRALSTAAQQAARAAKKQILETAAKKLEAHVDDLLLTDGRVAVGSSSERSLPLPHVLRAAKSVSGPVFGHGVSPDLPVAPIYVTQVADVAVDPETGEVEILRVVSVQDVGFAINPLGIEGQIEGGVLQGVGYATMEELRFEDGRIVNPHLDAYIIPTSRDAVEVITGIVEEPAPEGAFGVRGVGEPPIICTLAALANAVYDATGVRVRQLPLSPERVLTGLLKDRAAPENE